MLHTRYIILNKYIFHGHSWIFICLAVNWDSYSRVKCCTTSLPGRIAALTDISLSWQSSQSTSSYSCILHKPWQHSHVPPIILQYNHVIRANMPSTWFRHFSERCCRDREVGVQDRAEDPGKLHVELTTHSSHAHQKRGPDLWGSWRRFMDDAATMRGKETLAPCQRQLAFHRTKSWNSRPKPNCFPSYSLTTHLSHTNRNRNTK